jgi:hypothetical protein
MHPELKWKKEGSDIVSEAGRITKEGKRFIFFPLGGFRRLGFELQSDAKSWAEGDFQKRLGRDTTRQTRALIEQAIHERCKDYRVLKAALRQCATNLAHTEELREALQQWVIEKPR